jgi:hypothetical protein
MEDQFMRLLAIFAITLLLATPVVVADSPETVMVTYQIKPHQEDALKKVIDKHWQEAQRLGLVHATPHWVVQGSVSGKSYIVEIFTWRDSTVPDDAPKEITDLWRQMHDLTESRDGKPDLEFTAIEVVSTK